MSQRFRDPPSDPWLPAGSRLQGRFEIGERLGSSRASATYLARDLKRRDACVVKELSVAQVVRGATGADSWDPADFTKLVELFEREARILTHLEHPGVPRLIDHFTVETERDTRLYIVQERVPGKSLATLVAEGKHFDEREAISICREVADVLRHIHSLSPPLIHRDVKPSNVMLDQGGTVHLIDFGSVRSAALGPDGDGMTVVGTFGYMPIEQYESRALPASDLYALGGTVVFLLSHKAPHELPRRGMHLHFRPYVNVSDGFAAILARMLEPNPEDRYRSAGELLEDLERLLRGEVARPPAKRRRAVALAAAVALGAGAVGGASVLLREAAPPARVESVLETVAPPPIDAGPGSTSPVLTTNGMLTVDIYRDFTYVGTGFPMGRSTGQTALRLLTRVSRELLLEPVHLRNADVDKHYGALFLGNGDDLEISFILFREQNAWGLYVDENNDEDLTNDGAPMRNRGNGPLFATDVTVQLETRTARGTVTRPYHLWMWLTPTDDGERIRGSFYAMNHYRGTLVVADESYDAVAFEEIDHDGLYQESGLCIDIDRDEKCTEEREVFYHGDPVTFPEGSPRLVLDYP